ncbi:retropepsin-like aspartic protease [Flavobacterium enshiense]|uniref:aspartyl protease family protein n=1 Tax=Flavobacterium enshiense TaxID=1341165 RepID=UPI00345D4C81
MKGKILFLSVFVFFTNCKSYRDFLKIDKEYVTNVPDKLNDGRIVNGRIEGKNVSLLFDTGATKSVLFNFDVIGRESILKKSNGGIFVKGASGRIFIRKYVTDSIVFNSFRSLYQPLLLIDNDVNHNCNKNYNYDGLLGIDAFFENDNLLLLDHEKGELKIVVEKNEDYMPIDCEFGKKSIYIKGEIGKEKKLFLFDTGADVSILINKVNDKFPVLEEVEMLVSTINNNRDFKVSKTIFYQLDLVNIGGLNIENPLISCVSTMNQNLVGYNFIKKYNWIIDFKNKKLYAKGNSNLKSGLNEEALKAIGSKAVEINGKLIIVYKNISQKIYSVGDEIIMVNDKKVTPENICEIQKILNESNWETLSIETKSQQLISEKKI